MRPLLGLKRRDSQNGIQARKVVHKIQGIWEAWGNSPGDWS